VIFEENPMAAAIWTSIRYFSIRIEIPQFRWFDHTSTSRMPQERYSKHASFARL